jgi:hypothetical protein
MERYFCGTGRSLGGVKQLQARKSNIVAGEIHYDCPIALFLAPLPRAGQRS